mgnify:FL=1
MNKQASKTSTKKASGTRTGRTKLNYSLYLQYQDREYDMADLKELILEKCEAEEMDPKNLRIYVKPDDNKAYYVCAGGSSSIAL